MKLQKAQSCYFPGDMLHALSTPLSPAPNRDSHQGQEDMLVSPTFGSRRPLRHGRTQRRCSVTKPNVANETCGDGVNERRKGLGQLFAYDPPKKPRSCVLIEQPSSTRVLDMVLPSPPTKSREKKLTLGLPSSVSKLTKLKEHDCSFAQYRGPLAGETFASLRNLEYINLSGNSFGSSVPTELVSLPNLGF